MTKPSLLLRPDTILGVCEGLGEDLRIPANAIRVAFAAAIYFAPFATVATYLLLGLVVAATRYALPDPALPLLTAEASRDISPAPAERGDENIALAA